MADAATGKVISEMAAAQYVLFAAPPVGGIFYAVGQAGDVLAIGDRATVEAAEAAKAAAQRAALTAPATAPTAPTAEPATAPAAPVVAPAEAPKP